MAKTVFILGAGASKVGGAPLMKEFLDTADMVFKAGRVDPNDWQHFERVFRAVGKLQQVHSKHGSLDLVNIESVFGAFEMARTLGKLPGFDGAEIDALVPSMARLIVRTLELSLKFTAAQRKARPPVPYEDFVTLLVQLTEKAKPPHTVAVLTFNYDAALDFAIASTGRDVLYALPDDIVHVPPRSITLLKLHGSVNWFACNGANGHEPHVKAWPIGDAIAKAKELHTELGTVHYSMNFSQFDVCGRAAEAPLIVPPTWSKGEYHRQLRPVWQRAARELQDAENIIVIGYSLPPSDGFFPLLFGLGTVGDMPLRRFWVFDPDEAVGTRFAAMLGPGARERFLPIFTYPETAIMSERPHPASFADAIRKLRQEFRIS